MKNRLYLNLAINHYLVPCQIRDSALLYMHAMASGDSFAVLVAE